MGAQEAFCREALVAGCQASAEGSISCLRAKQTLASFSLPQYSCPVELGSCREAGLEGREALVQERLAAAAEQVRLARTACVQWQTFRPGMARVWGAAAVLSPGRLSLSPSSLAARRRRSGARRRCAGSCWRRSVKWRRSGRGSRRSGRPWRRHKHRWGRAGWDLDAFRRSAVYWAALAVKGARACVCLHASLQPLAAHAGPWQRGFQCSRAVLGADASTAALFCAVPPCL